MAKTLSPLEVEALAKANGLTLALLCARARVANSTFTRWKQDKTSPSVDVYDRLVAVASGEDAPEARPRKNAGARHEQAA